MCFGEICSTTTYSLLGHFSLVWQGKAGESELSLEGKANHRGRLWNGLWNEIVVWNWVKIWFIWNVVSVFFQYFAVTQMVRVLPTAISSLSNRKLRTFSVTIFPYWFFRPIRLWFIMNSLVWQLVKCKHFLQVNEKSLTINLPKTFNIQLLTLKFTNIHFCFLFRDFWGRDGPHLCSLLLLKWIHVLSRCRWGMNWIVLRNFLSSLVTYQFTTNPLGLMGFGCNSIITDYCKLSECK